MNPVDVKVAGSKKINKRHELSYLRNQTPAFYSLATDCHIHGWINLTPFSRSCKQQKLRFAMLADDDIYIKQYKDHSVHVETFSLHKLNRDEKEIIDIDIIRPLEQIRNNSNWLGD